MLHSDPSILGELGWGQGGAGLLCPGRRGLAELTPGFSLASGYSLHGSSGEIESVDDY